MAIFKEPKPWAHALGNNADVQELPDDTGATTGLASLQKLFQMITQTPIEAGGIAPDRVDFNSLFKLLGDSIFYAMNGGLASYNQAYDYPPNRVVVYGDGLYKCIHANGPDASVVVPGTNDAVWQKIPTTSDVSALIPIATTLIKGIVQLCDNIDANATDNSKALTPYAVARQKYVKSVNTVRADAYGNVSITRVDSAASADTAKSATNATHATTADEATHASTADTAKSATNATHATTADEATHASTADNAGMLTGFASHDYEFGWGVQIGTAIMVMADSTGGSVGFRRDCPSSGKTSMIIDGYVYQNEGLYQVIDTNTIGSQSVNYATYSSRSANNGSFFINGYEVSVG